MEGGWKEDGRRMEEGWKDVGNRTRNWGLKISMGSEAQTEVMLVYDKATSSTLLDKKLLSFQEVEY